MRDLVPRRAPDRQTITPWSTFVHATSCVPKTPPKPIKKRQSVSPSPVVHSTSPVPASPDGDTPSVMECPHDATQLPRRGVFRQQPKGAIDVFEEFIADLDAEAKESVRSTYNGSDWPGKWKPSIQRANYSRMSISNQSYLLPQTPYAHQTYVQNRFLVGLPISNPHYPVYQYFPRGL